MPRHPIISNGVIKTRVVSTTTDKNAFHVNKIDMTMPVTVIPTLRCIHRILLLKSQSVDSVTPEVVAVAIAIASTIQYTCTSYNEYIYKDTEGEYDYEQLGRKKV